MKDAPSGSLGVLRAGGLARAGLLCAVVELLPYHPSYRDVIGAGEHLLRHPWERAQRHTQGHAVRSPSVNRGRSTDLPPFYKRSPDGHDTFKQMDTVRFPKQSRSSGKGAAIRKP